MRTPIIRTADLSVETCRALFDALRTRHAIEHARLIDWQAAEREGRLSLTEAGMTDLAEKYNALRREFVRLNRWWKENHKERKQ